MDFISVIEFANKHGISERTARNYCSLGKIEGAFLTGKTWNIPADAALPQRRTQAIKNPLLYVLREQKSIRMKGGIYHRVQIDLLNGLPFLSICWTHAALHRMSSVPCLHISESRNRKKRA